MSQKTTKRNIRVKRFVLNCVESKNRDDDWTFEDAIDAGVVSWSAAIPDSVDLRENWWPVDYQGDTGACVGFATAYGVLRWHYVKAGWIEKTQKPSARFVWMANKETDEITSYPTTFLETSGTQTKLALGVARKYGCVLDEVLPMNGALTMMRRGAFYTEAARLRIASYHNLGHDLDVWRRWLAVHGPILTRLDVDQTWDRARLTNGRLETYLENTTRGGHAICLVGYTPDHFIVRNSWGEKWGDEGFGYASNAYAEAAFLEAYGAVL
ncbi:MAG: C1 family peptidase [Anaerolineales bacterium]|nr:C1 family peptidase [Anaerolineales bacterium]MCA9930111.1 C1 family peptidase [Anaerolineales bacterium]